MSFQLFGLVIAALSSPLVRGQGDLSAANNVTGLMGTWSSNPAVSTGSVSRIITARLLIVICATTTAAEFMSCGLWLIHVAGLLYTGRDEVLVSQQYRHLLLLVSCPIVLPACPLTIWPSTDDGFFEEALYRYTANGSNPSCIQATIQWQHGTFGLNNNGSMTLYPFGSDGRIQVQDPCAAVTNIITYIDQQVSCT